MSATRRVSKRGGTEYECGASSPTSFNGIAVRWCHAPTISVGSPITWLGRVHYSRLRGCCNGSVYRSFLTKHSVKPTSPFAVGGARTVDTQSAISRNGSLLAHGTPAFLSRYMTERGVLKFYR